MEVTATPAILDLWCHPCRHFRLTIEGHVTTSINLSVPVLFYRQVIP